jgi:hypothetical protein
VELLQLLGRVPRRLIWDNESGIGRGKRRAEGVSVRSPGTLATTLQRSSRDPESKGIVERSNGWFETSFMPGREFASPADFNDQFGRVAHHRQRPGRAHDQGSPGRPARRRQGGDAAAAAGATGTWAGSTGSGSGRDYYVRVDSNDYSVDPA